MASVTYTPREAAVMSGAPLAAIQKAISAGRIPASIVGEAPRRQIDETALLAFALAGAMPAEINLSPGAAYDLLRRAGDQARAVELGMNMASSGSTPIRRWPRSDGGWSCTGGRER
jgi:hypothetical protein